MVIGVWQDSKYEYVSQPDLCDVCVIFTQHLAMAGIHTQQLPAQGGGCVKFIR